MRRVALLGSLSLTLGFLLTPAQAAGTVRVTNGCVDSVPDEGSSTPQKICYTLFQPPRTDAQHRVPLIFHSHGWGGSRSTDPSDFTAFLNAGYGVLSFDQRGFGQGITDTLFPLHQGLQNFAKALTPAAQKKSIFVGYNGGHVLPFVFPQATAPSGDPCSKKLAGGSFTALTVKFFDHALKG
jgi:pimeloyl-ACP methyl ester carboxylesterase